MLITRQMLGSVRGVEWLPFGARVTMRVARDGVQDYRLPNGKLRREYRSADTLRKMLPALKDVPITIGHPQDGRVSPEDYARLARGHASEVSPDLEFDGKYHWAVIRATITDPGTLARLTSRDLCETSLASDALIKDFGPPGEGYDAEQPVAVPLSIALLPKGGARAGSECRPLLDSLDEPYQLREDTNKMDVKEFVAELEAKQKEIDGLKAQIATLEATASAATVRADSASTELSARDTLIGTLTSERDELKAAADAVSVDALVAAELAFRDAMRPGLPKDYKFEGKSRTEVRRDSIKYLGGTVAADASDAVVEGYLTARLDSLKDGAGKARIESNPTTPAEIRAAKLASVAKGKK